MTISPTRSANRPPTHQPAPTRPPRLSRRTRKAVLLLHVLSSVSWIGVDLVMGALAVRGLTTDDPRTQAVVYASLELFAVPLLLTLGLLSLSTGLVLGVGTRFGLVRYWWVVAKLVVTLVLLVLVLLALRPTVLEAATEAAVVDGSLPGRLADARVGLVFPPAVSVLALSFATWLAVYKPWGATARGRRFARVSKKSR